MLIRVLAWSSLQKRRAPRPQSHVRSHDEDERAGEPPVDQFLRERLRRRAGVETALRGRLSRRHRRRIRYVRVNGNSCDKIEMSEHLISRVVSEQSPLNNTQN